MLLEIVFAAGCFWGVERYFAEIDGVVDVVAGYAGGNYANPTYKNVLKNRNDNNKNIINHTEVVKVRYDATKISTENLIKNFWQIHDPTQLNRQGNDIGNNYRSAIYYRTKEQKDLAVKTRDIFQKLLTEKGYGKIVTEIKPLDKFYQAEEYHQDYLVKNPQGYCPNHATGVRFSDDKQSTKNITPIGGLEILVLEPANNKFCPFCDKFKKEVVSKYKGNIKIRFAARENLAGFELKTIKNITPIIYFIKNGKELWAHEGYLKPYEFYKTLGQFKFGKNSQEYKVAFNSDTDNRFCSYYEKYKNTPAGVFIDKFSGVVIFDSKDRFDSGSGWLSFTKATNEQVYEKADNSYGMQRVEVLAKISGVHLGHVFDDGPAGSKRYCINASVLEFVKHQTNK
jgi:peptide methionine sulfoxide reductase msrA/msrB